MSDGQDLTWYGFEFPEGDPHRRRMVATASEPARGALDPQPLVNALMRRFPTPGYLEQQFAQNTAAQVRTMVLGRADPVEAAKARQVHGPLTWRTLGDLVDADSRHFGMSPDLLAAPGRVKVAAVKAANLPTPFGTPHRVLDDLALAAGINRLVGGPADTHEVSTDELIQHLRPRLEADTDVVTLGGRWTRPDEHTETATIPGDAVATRLFATQIALGDALLAETALTLPQPREQADMRSTAAITTRALAAATGRALAASVPFYLPALTTAGVAASRPPSEEITEDLRMPFRACLLALGAPLHLAPSSRHWPSDLARHLAVAPSGTSAAACDLAEARGTGPALDLPAANPPVSPMTAAFARGALVDALVLLAHDDGRLADEMLWALRVPGRTRATLARGSRRLAVAKHPRRPRAEPGHRAFLRPVERTGHTAQAVAQADRCDGARRTRGPPRRGTGPGSGT